MVSDMSVGNVPAGLWSSTRGATNGKTELDVHEHGYMVATRYEWAA
jgi:hypothetical protein